MKKNLTLETDNFLKEDKEEEKEKTSDKCEKEEEDDDFGRDEDSKPMTKEELE